MPLHCSGIEHALAAVHEEITEKVRGYNTSINENCLHLRWGYGTTRAEGNYSNLLGNWDRRRGIGRGEFLKISRAVFDEV